MKRNLVRFAAFAFALGFGAVAAAQSSQTLRGDIAAVDGNTLHLKSAAGQETIVKLPDKASVSLRVPASLDAIKPGTFVGTAATPGPNGTLVASEVHIFPESMRGTGEGHRPMPSLPGSTMTNATVANVSGAPASKGSGTMTNATVENVGAAGKARTLKLTYKGGEQTVVVPDKTPIVMVEAGSRASLTPGAHVIVYAQRDANGGLTAQRVSVGKNGSVPPI
jgi:Domain of unknown function (DUF5666)